MQSSHFAGRFRPSQRIIAEAKNKGLGSSQQAKVSAPAESWSGDFCGCATDFPMLALLQLLGNGRERNKTETKIPKARLSPGTGIFQLETVYHRLAGMVYEVQTFCISLTKSLSRQDQRDV